QQYCLSCHKARGEGLENIYPALAGSLIVEDEKTFIEAVRNGLSTGRYDYAMPAFNFLEEEELEKVLNYVRTSFGNKLDSIDVTPILVKKDIFYYFTKIDCIFRKTIAPTDAENDSKPVISLKDVSKVYESGDNSITALTSTDHTLYNGVLALIMGPSGSGKTTLLSIIGCVIYPTTGEVSFLDQKISGLKENELAAIRLEKIGFVFQQFNLIEPLTALENVIQPLLLQKAVYSEAKRRATDAL